MNEEIGSLTPECVWKIFANLIAIPRISGHEAKVREYLRNLAENAGLHTQTDNYGNLMIEKPASLGWAGCRTVVLQAHLDIVAQKKPDFEFDFLTDPIPAIIRNGQVVAENTTLGSDNGVGVALAMAAMLSQDFNHCPLKAVFTVEEEIGLRGAMALPGEWFTYPHMMINMDSESLNKLHIGCAGGARTAFSIIPEWADTPAGHFTMSATLSGLSGGHSGADIHRNRGNALILLANFINSVPNINIRLSGLNGGSVDNAIPRDATAIFTLSADSRESLTRHAQSIEKKLRDSEPNASITIKTESTVKKVFTADFQNKILNAIISCPNGALEVSRHIPGLTATSSNLAIISTAPDIINIYSSQRSENDASRRELTAKLIKHFNQIGAIAQVSNEYPGWEPNPDSRLIHLFQNAAESILGHKLSITAIHAGLECGVIGALNKNLEIVSFGPNQHNIHAPGESVEIESVGKCWEILKHVLANA
ncbi:MAG: beta-Ala-His dipeptidase [Victivallaceae bacterium]|nr:beta-Ala-His dipeptidase [Victivallaceae bacterium]